jgi:hypothetical protein
MIGQNRPAAQPQPKTEMKSVTHVRAPSREGEPDFPGTWLGWKKVSRAPIGSALNSRLDLA